MSHNFVVTVQSGKFIIDGDEDKSITLYKGHTYTFDTSDTTNAGYNIRLTYWDGFSLYTARQDAEVAYNNVNDARNLVYISRSPSLEPYFNAIADASINLNGAEINANNYYNNAYSPALTTLMDTSGLLAAMGSLSPHDVSMSPPTPTGYDYWYLMYQSQLVGFANAEVELAALNSIVAARINDASAAHAAYQVAATERDNLEAAWDVSLNIVAATVSNSQSALTNHTSINGRFPQDYDNTTFNNDWNFYPNNPAFLTIHPGDAGSYVSFTVPLDITYTQVNIYKWHLYDQNIIFQGGTGSHYIPFMINNEPEPEPEPEPPEPEPEPEPEPP